MNWVALRMLMGDKSKYLGVLLGVTLAATLIIHQVTIFTGLMARTWAIVQDLRASASPDLMVTDPGTEFLDDVKPIADTAVERVRSLPGVEWAVPWYKGQIKAKMADGKFRTCTVIGLDDDTLIGAPPEMVSGTTADLRVTDGVIVDNLHAQGLLAGVDAQGNKVPVKVGDTIELNDRRAVVVGLCHSTRPFISQPILYTTMSNALRWSPPERRKVSAVLVRLHAGADAAAVREEITGVTGLSPNTPGEFGWKCVRYYLKNTGIPINFGITIMLGAIVGIAIAGQTFYLFILDNIKNLGALKAMGATNGMLTRMVLLQTGLCGVVGYGLGCMLAMSLFVPFKKTEIDFDVYWQVLALAAGAIALIVFLASLVGLRKVFATEPAIVFK